MSNRDGLDENISSAWSISGSKSAEGILTSAGVGAAGKESSLAAGSVFKGTLSFAGSASIDGQLDGELSCAGELLIGEQGEVKANINAGIIRVFGSVRGDVVAKELIELFSGASVLGNISSPRLIMHDGVIFEGHCRMEKASRESAQQANLELEVTRDSSAT